MNQFKSKLNKHVGGGLGNVNCTMVSILMEELIFYFCLECYILFCYLRQIFYNIHVHATAASVTITISQLLFSDSQRLELMYARKAY